MSSWNGDSWFLSTCIFSKFILELLTQAVCCLLFACLLNRRVLRRSNRAKVKQLTKELELLAHHIDEPGNILIVLLLYTCWLHDILFMYLRTCISQSHEPPAYHLTQDKYTAYTCWWQLLHTPRSRGCVGGGHKSWSVVHVCIKRQREENNLSLFP